MSVRLARGSRKLLKTMMPGLNALFWKHERLALGLWGLYFLLMLILYTEGFVWKLSGLFTMKFVNENMYWHGTGNINVFCCVISCMWVLSAIDIGLFHIQLSTDRYWTYETYVFVCKISNFFHKTYTWSSRFCTNHNTNSFLLKSKYLSSAGQIVQKIIPYFVTERK